MRSPLGSDAHPLVRRLMKVGLSTHLKAAREGSLDELRRSQQATRLEPRKGRSLIDRVLTLSPPKIDRHDHLIPRPDGSQLRMRVHRPRSAGTKPAFLYIHGGGFYLGTPEESDTLCARIAHEADVTVVAVNYRLAPEHPFPAGLDDCMQALRWLRSEPQALDIDPEWIGVGGGSAGGNLSAVVGLLARDEQIPVRVLVLEVPLLDLTSPMHELDSMKEFQTFFDSEHRFTVENYVGDLDASDQHFSPALAKDLSGLPPTYVLACDADPLVFQERDYVRRMRAAGAQATLFVFPGLAHGLSNLTRFLPAARDFQATMIAAIRSELVAMRP